MGATYSTIQIRNHLPANPENFKNLLCGHFEKKGLIPATEEDAQFSYWLAFSDDSDWVTLGSGGYDLGAAHTEVPEFAEELHTHIILTSVYDSDFCELHLFCPDGQKDILTAGQVYDEDMYAEPNRELWEPLLAEGKKWEHITEIRAKIYTFAEDALGDIAQVLGMTAAQVTNNYDCSEETASGAPHIIDLYFKHAQQQPVASENNDLPDAPRQKPVKSASLNTVFKQKYAEALEPLGYIKLKGRYPYFVRLVGNEIIEVIAYRNENGRELIGSKAFNILAGVATVYRHSIDLKKAPQDNMNWIRFMDEYYNRVYPIRDNNDVRKSISRFDYIAGDDADMLRAVEYSLEMAKQIILPIFDEVNDLDSCLMYMRKHQVGAVLNIYGDDQYFGDQSYGFNYPTQTENESLLFVKTNYRGDFMELVQSREAYESAENQLAERGVLTRYSGNFEKYLEGMKKYALRLKTGVDMILDNPESYSKTLVELECRRARNTEILRGYGFDV
jgi:hypothetical protein